MEHHNTPGNTATTAASAAATHAATQPWPATLPEQVRAVAQLLGVSPAPLPLSAIEAGFKARARGRKTCPASSTRWKPWAARGMKAAGGAERIAGRARPWRPSPL